MAMAASRSDRSGDTAFHTHTEKYQRNPGPHGRKTFGEVTMRERSLRDAVGIYMRKPRSSVSAYLLPCRARSWLRPPGVNESGGRFRRAGRILPPDPLTGPAPGGQDAPVKTTGFIHALSRPAACRVPRARVSVTDDSTIPLSAAFRGMRGPGR